MEFNLSTSANFTGLNYAVITGIVKKRKGLNMTISGLAVLHLLIENTVEKFPGSTEVVTSEIEVVAWADLAIKMDKKLSEGTPVLIEGTLSHKKTKDRAGSEYFKTLLKARRISLMQKSKERKA